MQWIVGAEHAPTLEALGREASKIEITAAFLSLEGARFVLDLSDSCPVDLTVSAFMGVTRRSALQLLLGALREPTGSGHRLRVRVARQREKGLHAKVYKFQMEDGRLVWVVGSANLTHTGLHSMGEVSA